MLQTKDIVLVLPSDGMHKPFLGTITQATRYYRTVDGERTRNEYYKVTTINGDYYGCNTEELFKTGDKIFKDYTVTDINLQSNTVTLDEVVVNVNDFVYSKKDECYYIQIEDGDLDEDEKANDCSYSLLGYTACLADIIEYMNLLLHPTKNNCLNSKFAHTLKHFYGKKASLSNLIDMMEDYHEITKFAKYRYGLERNDKPKYTKSDIADLLGYDFELVEGE